LVEAVPVGDALAEDVVVLVVDAVAVEEVGEEVGEDVGDDGAAVDVVRLGAGVDDEDEDDDVLDPESVIA
jgi:hypothetical protein